MQTLLVWCGFVRALLVTVNQQYQWLVHLHSLASHLRFPPDASSRLFFFKKYNPTSVPVNAWSNQEISLMCLLIPTTQNLLTSLTIASSRSIGELRSTQNIRSPPHSDTGCRAVMQWCPSSWTKSTTTLPVLLMSIAAIRSFLEATTAVSSNPSTLGLCNSECNIKVYQTYTTAMPFVRTLAFAGLSDVSLTSE